MTIAVKAYANADDVLIAWQPDKWSDDWAGFQLERRNETTQQITVVVNRIPPTPGQGPVQPAGIASAQSPIRRCIWTDHNAVATDSVAYRVTAIKDAGNGAFAIDAASASAWTEPLVTSGDAGGGLEAYFNRGTLMSQVVSRFVKGDVTPKSLRQFLTNLEEPGFAARQYLAGEARHEILLFLREADRRSSDIHAAIYEINDRELVEALKPFGSRGHVLIGNGGATKPWVAQELTAAGLDVKHRDLSHHGKSSPSVHNKFVVESDSAGAGRVLTGSTNWTTSGLCTQLNNVLIVENKPIASRYRDQWDKLVAAGDDMPASLKTANSAPAADSNITLYFAATDHEAEFKPVLDLIAKAEEGILFLMFTPGQSPLLSALLDRVKKNDIYVRGVVSNVTASKHGGADEISSVGGQVIKSGAPAQEFHHDVELPSGVSEGDRPSWAETEFSVSEIKGAHLMAIVHSKTIVIDPFSDNCAVVTGSHNFSDSASAKNDENLVIIRGNQKLAQAYALHINGVYDHYSWRAFLASGGNPDQIYKPLDAWKPGGSRAQELEFWMSGKVSPQPEEAVPLAGGATSPATAAPKPRARPGTAAPKKARKTAATPRPAAGQRKKTAAKKTAFKTGVTKTAAKKRAAQPKAKKKKTRGW
jgi:phosphatidylserine/phosphatidylglycerophosphate/cardiolipin synthase-like enzyme